MNRNTSNVASNGATTATLEDYNGMRAILVGSGAELEEFKTLLRGNGYKDVVSLTMEGLIDADVFATGKLNMTFMFVDGESDELVKQVVDRIRNDSRENTRLQPIMVLAPSYTADRARKLVNMGVDTSVMSPADPIMLASRFGTMITRPPKFFRTGTFFGPDRRRLEKNGAAEHQMRGTGNYQWEEITVVRSVSEGSYVNSKKSCSSAGQGDDQKQAA